MNTCDWCEAEADEVNRINSDMIMCDECKSGVTTCSVDTCEEWMHSDVGTSGNDGYIGDDYYCGECIDSAKEEAKREEQWIPAMSAFCEIAKKLEYNAEEVTNQLKQNKRHNGGLSEQVLESWNGENIAMDAREVSHICEMLDVSTSRHNDTNYDTMLHDGMSRDIARIATY